MSEYFLEKMSNRIQSDQTVNIQMHPKDIQKTSNRSKKTTKHIQKDNQTHPTDIQNTSKRYPKDIKKTPKTHPEHIQNPWFHHFLSNVWDFVEGTTTA